MAIHMLASVLVLLFLLGGCGSTPPLPGAVKQVSGPLRSIDLFPTRPSKREDLYGTAGRDRLFASDREVWVVLTWEFPAPGSYVTKVALQTPTGTPYGERKYDVEAKGSRWASVHMFPLPLGEDAHRLAGPWRVEVALENTAVGQRVFTFDSRSIRLRTDARILIVQGTDDPEAAAGDWTWQNRAGVLEHVKGAHATLGVVLRDELARRFRHVEGPRQSPTDPGGTILLRTKFITSPNPDTDARLSMDVVPVPPQTARTFIFRSSAGVELMGTSRSRNLTLAAADLAFQAATNPEVLDFLITASHAVPE